MRPGGRPSTTLHRRVEAAAAFGERFADPLFVPTGGVGRFGPSEASVMAALLVSRGVPGERILLEETGTDTLSSVRAVAALLRHAHRRTGVRGEQSVSSAALSVVAAADGRRRTAAVPPVVPAATNWWRRCYWWLREVPALPYDVMAALFQRWRGRSDPR